MRHARYPKPDSTKVIRQIVFDRADGLCECGCGSFLGDGGHMDHFFGRAKVEELVINCWALCLACDDAKTNNRPSAIHWLERFSSHCAKYGYMTPLSMAQTKIAVLHAKGFTK